MKCRLNHNFNKLCGDEETNLQLLQFNFFFLCSLLWGCCCVVGGLHG